jgi:iron-sulfur cluster repair protein YtfE (RIC family)
MLVRGKIMNWLNHDHQNFEEVVYQCRTACDAQDWPAVRRIFEKFASNYESHVRIEEEVLFPAYDAHPGTSMEPTTSLKADHVQIFRLIRHITQQLGNSTHADLGEDLSLLYRTLSIHHDKEEEIFLPMASEALYSDKDAILTNLSSQSG